MNIDRDTSLRMRGAAIFMIFLHNLFHMTSKAKECEFLFVGKRVTAFLDHFTLSSPSCIEDVFSFFGWYGVPVFMFLSGYGLTCKHELAGKKVKPIPYLCRNYVKLFLLMAPCFIAYLVIKAKTMSVPLIITQFAMVSNLFYPLDISPGVYWYFGLTLQFYVIYLLFYYCRKNYFVYAFMLVALVAGVYFAMYHPDYLHAKIRHNSLLWLPVFLAGILCARMNGERLMAFFERHWIWCVPILLAIWIYSCFNVYLWTLSPVVVLLLFLVLGKRLGHAGECKFPLLRPIGIWFSKGLIYLGTISAGLFVVHPFFRIFALNAIGGGYSKWMVVPCYILVCIIGAAIYQKVYQLVIKRVLK